MTNEYESISVHPDTKRALAIAKVAGDFSTYDDLIREEMKETLDEHDLN